MAVVSTVATAEMTWQRARRSIDFPPLGEWKTESGLKYTIFVEDGHVFFRQENFKPAPLLGELVPILSNSPGSTQGNREWLVLLEKEFEFTLRLEGCCLHASSKFPTRTLHTKATLDSGSKNPLRLELTVTAWKKIIADEVANCPRAVDSVRAACDLFGIINEFNKRLKEVRNKDNEAFPDVVSHLINCLARAFDAKPVPWVLLTVAAKQLYEWEYYMPTQVVRLYDLKEVKAIKELLGKYSSHLMDEKPESLWIPAEVVQLTLEHARALMAKDSEKYKLIHPAGMLSLVVASCLAGKCSIPTASPMSLTDLLEDSVMQMGEDAFLQRVLPQVAFFLSETHNLTLDVYQGLARACKYLGHTQPHSLPHIIGVLKQAVPRHFLLPTFWGVMRYLDDVQVALNRNDLKVLGYVFQLASDERELCSIFQTLLKQKVERGLRLHTIAQQLSNVAVHAAGTTRLMEAQDILGQVLVEAMSKRELGSAGDILKMLSEKQTILLHPAAKLDLYKRSLPDAVEVDKCVPPETWDSIFMLASEAEGPGGIDMLLLSLIEATEHPHLSRYRLEALRAAEARLNQIIDFDAFLDGMSWSTISSQELRPESRVDTSLMLKLIPHLDEVAPSPDLEKPFLTWLGEAVSRNLHFPMGSAIDKRLTFRSGKMAHGLASDVDRDWVEDWASFRKVVWPSLQPLLKLYWPAEPTESHVIKFFLEAWTALEAGELPVAAYRELRRMEINQFATSESQEIPSIIACVLELHQQVDHESAWSQVDHCLTTQAARCDELTDMLRKQQCLLDWLVENGFRDGKEQQQVLKQRLVTLDERPLKELEAAVAIGGDEKSQGSTGPPASAQAGHSGPPRCQGIFSGLVNSTDPEALAFMQHCVLRGSDLLQPVLQHLMDEQRTASARELNKNGSTLSYGRLGRSVGTCYWLYRRLFGLDCSSAKLNPKELDAQWDRVRPLIIKELSKNVGTLPRRLSVLSDFENFALVDRKRKDQIRNACLFDTFQSKLKVITPVLQQFKWDWAVDTNYQEMCSMANKIMSEGYPEIDTAAMAMEAVFDQLSIDATFDFNIFDKLREHEAVFEFFAKRKAMFARDGGLANGFRERLKIVRNSLQEEAKDRQKLLHELEACFDILLPFLEQDQAPRLLQARRCLQVAFSNLWKHQSRIKSFDTVSKQLELFQALFDSKGKGRWGVAELVLTVRDMMRGSIYINPFDGSYCCKYKGLAGEDAEVVVSQMGLQDYIMRCNMEMVEPHTELLEHDAKRQEQLQQDRETIGRFLRQVEAVVGTDSALVTTSQQFCKEGHPEFRSREVRFDLSRDLKAVANLQLARLELWAEHLRDAFKKAELLELLPRPQMFHWMVAMAESDDAWDSLKEEMREALALWCSETPEWALAVPPSKTESTGGGAVRRFWKQWVDGFQGGVLFKRRGSESEGPGLDESTDHFTRWLRVLVEAFQGLKADIQGGASNRGRIIVNAENATPGQILQYIAEQFLNGSTHSRLPRFAEVLFCEAMTDHLAVEAFLRRCERFLGLTFVLVEPNLLPPESKECVARWLNTSRTGNVLVILTAYWPLTFAPVERQTLTLGRGDIVQRWLHTCPVHEISVYPAERTTFTSKDVEGLHVASGKSTTIRQICEDLGGRLLSVIVDESFSIRSLVEKIKGSYQPLEHHVDDSDLEAIEVNTPFTHLHLDLTPYSDHNQVNVLLRNLLLCGTLIDPESGLVAPLHAGLHLHIELGSLVTGQDDYSLREYATVETVKAKFSSLKRDQLHLGLLYPVVGLLGNPDRAHAVRASPLLLHPQHFPRPLIGGEHIEGEELCAAATLTLKVMYAAITPQPFAGDDSWFLDMGTAEMADFIFLGQEQAELGLEEVPRSEALQKMTMQIEEIHELMEAGVTRLPIAHLPMPDDPSEILAQFAGIKCGVHLDNHSKALQAVMVKALSVFAEWSSSSRLLQDGGIVMNIRSLLLQAACCCLRSPEYSDSPLNLHNEGVPRGMDEACLYFVPGFWGEDRGDFKIYVPSLVEGRCRRGRLCPCNAVRESLRAFVGEQVLVMEQDDLGGMSLQHQAIFSAEQSYRVLACALGLTTHQVVDILERDEYILNRDFTCKFLELDWRRKARVPVIIQGESGTGKSRLLRTYVRLLMESSEARPPLLKALYDQMRGYLCRRKEVGGRNLGEVEAAMNRVLRDGFSSESFLELLRQDGLWAAVPTEAGDLTPIFAADALVDDLLKSLRDSPRYDVGLLNFMLAPPTEADAEDGDEGHRGLVGDDAGSLPARQQTQFRSLTPVMQQQYRDQDTRQLLIDRVERPTRLQRDQQQAVLQELVRVVADLPPEQIYFPVQLHADVSPDELFSLVEPAREACRKDPGTTILLFLDEANTSSCLGVIKAMMCDNLLTQEHPNLLIVAAINPYRPEVVRAVRSDSGMRDFFQVHPSPESCKDYIWPWRASEDNDERDYITERFRRFKSKDASFEDIDRFINTLVAAQKFMRETHESMSAVSQRDIMRFFVFLRFFVAHLSQRERDAKADAAALEGTEESKKALSKLSTAMEKRRLTAKSCLLSLSLVYYLGLKNEQRNRFEDRVTRPLCRNLAAVMPIETLSATLTAEMDLYFDHITLPAAVAPTRALKENMFAVIVCIHCSVPVMIVGMPGTGKTLAVNLATTDVLKGDRSEPFFKNFAYVSESVIRYQCSKESTSKEIHEVFERAATEQRIFDQNRQAKKAMVFIDEAGLPDEKVESLKAIHYHFDAGVIPACLLANRPLDAAKRNRAVQVYREASDPQDLQRIAKEALKIRDQDITNIRFADGLCKAFQFVTKVLGSEQSSVFSRPVSFDRFHLRDFTYLLRDLRVNGYSTNVSVLRSLERNFGGISEDDFAVLVDVFFEQLGQETMKRPDPKEFRGVLEVVKEALLDVPSDADIQAEDYQPRRYTMIVDETDDGSALRVLQEMGALEPELEVNEVSDLPGDTSQLHQSVVVSRIRSAAAKPGVHVLTGFESALDGFYDLLNLRFLHLTDSTGCCGFMATVAFGNYSRLAHVHPRFKLVVLVRASELAGLPLPLLNRFEKYRISALSWAVETAHRLTGRLAKPDFLQHHLLGAASQSVETLVSSLGKTSLIGYQHRVSPRESPVATSQSQPELEASQDSGTIGPTVSSLLAEALPSQQERLDEWSLLLNACSASIDQLMTHRFLLPQPPSGHGGKVGFGSQRNVRRPDSHAATARHELLRQAIKDFPMDLASCGWSSDEVRMKQMELWNQHYDSELLTCRGHQNVGNTCYLQAPMTLLTVHGTHLIDPDMPVKDPKTADLVVAANDLKAAVTSSKASAVKRTRMAILEESLVDLKLVEKGQQLDAAQTLEQLLDAFGGRRLAWRCIWRLPEEDRGRVFQKFGKEEAAKQHLEAGHRELHMMRLSLSSSSHLDLQALLDRDRVEAMESCSFGDGSKKLKVNGAARVRQRIEGELPPKLLPICLQRWCFQNESWESGQKNNAIVHAPMAGLLVPVLSPRSEPFEDGELEAWSYDLRSFVVHIGDLNGGHYRAYWRKGAQWQCVDNDVAREISLGEAQHEADKAYLLVYELSGWEPGSALEQQEEDKNDDTLKLQLLQSDVDQEQGMAAATFETTPELDLEEQIDNEKSKGNDTNEEERWRSLLSEIIVGLVMHVVRRLLQLAPSETVIAQRQLLPSDLKEDFANHQPHFGLGSVVAKLKSGHVKKCVVYTRTVLSQHEVFDGDWQRSDATIIPMPKNQLDMAARLMEHKQRFILGNEDSKPLIIMCRVSEHFKLPHQASRGAEQIFSQRAVNHLRRCIDGLGVAGVAVVLLLQPQWYHTRPCYGAVFVKEWEFFHLDTLSDGDAPFLVPTVLLEKEVGYEASHRDISAGDTQSFDEDLWKAIFQLNPPKILGKQLEEWTDGAAVFYRAGAGLFARREALSKFLDGPGRRMIKLRLKHCYGIVLQGQSLASQTDEAARRIIGTGAGGAAPALQCLQATVRAAASSRLSSILAAGLFGLADQGGLRALSELGHAAEEASACYVEILMRQAAASPETQEPRQLLPPLGGQSVFPRFFSSVFDGLQTSLLQAGNSDEDVSFDSRNKRGHEDSLEIVRSAIARSSLLLNSYCGFTLWRLGLASTLVTVMVDWVSRFQDEAKLLVLHWVCWRRRSDLAALGMLLEQRVQIDTTKYQPSKDDLAQGKALSQDLVTSVLRDLKSSLLPSLESSKKQDRWLRSFETIAAVIDSDGGGDLLHEEEVGADYIWMRFVATLLPSVKIDELEVGVLVNIAMETDPRDPRDSGPIALPSSLEMRRLTFRRLADLAKASSSKKQGNQAQPSPYKRVAQRLLEEMLSASQSDGPSAEDCELALDVISDDGLFGHCPGFISVAFGSVVLQRLLQASTADPDRLWKFCNELNVRIGRREDLKEQFWPLSANHGGHMPWPPSANVAVATTVAGTVPWKSQLAHFLFHAMHGKPELAGVFEGEDMPGIVANMKEAMDDSNRFQDGAFNCIQGSARLMIWIDLAADFLAKTRPESMSMAMVQEVREFFRLIRSHEEQEDSPTEFMFFLLALAKRTGSTVMASAVLRDISEAHLSGGPPQVKRWVTVMQRPEQANSGAGEDPWLDFPTSHLPGFEKDEDRRRRIAEAEEQATVALVAGQAKHCPQCNRVIQRSSGCDQMECGRHAHDNTATPEGCGHVFSWNAARIFQPGPQRAVGAQSGFTSFRHWISTSQDFASPAAIQAIKTSLQGLSGADQRFCVGNVCACQYLKAGTENVPFANALLAPDNAEFLLALGFPKTPEGRKMARVVAAFCAPSLLGLHRSGIITAEALLGRDLADFDVRGEDPQTFAKQFQNALINLLVAIVGSEGNNHLAMALCNPSEMRNTFPVGFIYGHMPGPEGWHFDCGCVLQSNGQPSSSGKTYTSFASHHLHFVNFCTWGALSVGYLLLEDHTEESIYRILTQEHVESERLQMPNREVRIADKASSFSLTFAKEAFRFILHSTHNMSGEDRGLCLTQICLHLRNMPAGEGGRTFATLDLRNAYEQRWIQWIDDSRARLRELQTVAMGRSEAQQGLKKLYDFRAGLSHMLRFFPDFAQICLTIPPDTRFSFIRKIAEAQGELSTLSLLGDIVRVQKWINDNLNGKVVEDDLKKPFVSFLQDRAEVDWSKGRMGDHLRCLHLEQVIFPELVRNWKRFHQEHNGRIPIECQAGREEMQAAQGQAADENSREAIETIEAEGQKVPLRFFLDLDGRKCDARLVAEYLARQANHVVNSAFEAASELETMSAWAEHMNQAVPVWLCDVLIQGRFQELAAPESLQIRILGSLEGMEASGSPIVDWAGVQQDLLIRHANRLKQMSFPDPPPFVLLAETSGAGKGVALTLSVELQQQVKTEAMGLRSHDLQACQQLAAYAAKLASSCTSEDDILKKPITDAVKEHREFASVAQAAQDLFHNVILAEAEAVKVLLDGFHAEFADISRLLKAPLPEHIDLVEIFQQHQKIEAVTCTNKIADLDGKICEAITDLQGSAFVSHLESGAANDPLAATCAVIWCGVDYPISELPDDVHGKHLEVVLEALRQLLRLVRLRKSHLVKNLTWSPHATELQHINITDAQASHAIIPEIAEFEPKQEQDHHSEAEMQRPPAAASLLPLLQEAVLHNCRVSNASLRDLMNREPVVEECMARYQVIVGSDEAPWTHLPVQILGELIDACAAAVFDQKTGPRKQQAQKQQQQHQRKHEKHEEEEEGEATGQGQEQEGHEPKWMTTLVGFSAQRLRTLMDSEAAQSCLNSLLNKMLLIGREPSQDDSKDGKHNNENDSNNINEDGDGGQHEGQGLAASDELRGIWIRFLEVLGSTSCRELEETLLSCAGPSNLDIFSTPLPLGAGAQSHREVKKMTILSWDSCYFEVHPKEVVEGTEQDSTVANRHNEAASILQRAWRRHQTRKAAAMILQQAWRKRQAREAKAEEQQRKLQIAGEAESSQISTVSSQGKCLEVSDSAVTNTPLDVGVPSPNTSSISTRSGTPQSQVRGSLLSRATLVACSDAAAPSADMPTDAPMTVPQAAATKVLPTTKVEGIASTGKHPEAVPSMLAMAHEQTLEEAQAEKKKEGKSLPPACRSSQPSAAAPVLQPAVSTQAAASTDAGYPFNAAFDSCSDFNMTSETISRRPSFAETTRSGTSQQSSVQNWAQSQPLKGSASKVATTSLPKSLQEWFETLDRAGKHNNLFSLCWPVLKSKGYDTVAIVAQGTEETFFEALGEEECLRLKKLRVKVLRQEFQQLQAHYRLAPRPETVTEWLESIGLGEYAEAFGDHGVEQLDELLHIEEDDLNEIEKGFGAPLSEGRAQLFWHHLSLLQSALESENDLDPDT